MRTSPPLPSTFRNGSHKHLSFGASGARRRRVPFSFGEEQHDGNHPQSRCTDPLRG